MKLQMGLGHLVFKLYCRDILRLKSHYMQAAQPLAGCSKSDIPQL